VGESVLELFLSGGVSALTELSGGGIAAIVEIALDWIGAEDLGERVKHYLDSCKVDVRGDDGAWLALHGLDADATALAEGLGPMTLLEVAWHCVSEGLRPLFVRLASLGLGQDPKSSNDSGQSEKTD
jgi:hypothetical protein